jgi:CRP-like cAMP-binding protein
VIRAQGIATVAAIAGKESIHSLKPFQNDESPRVRAAAIASLIRHSGLDGILQPRSATVTVTDDLIAALKIRREDFTEMVAGKGEIAMGIIKVLTYRLRQANIRSQ